MHYQMKQREAELRGIEEARGMAKVYDIYLPVRDITQRLSISTKDVESPLSSQGLLPNPA